MEKFEKYIQSEINEFEENANLFSESNKRELWEKISGARKKKMIINYKLLFYIAASFFLLSGSSIVIMHSIYTKNFEQLSNFNEKLLHEIHTQKSTYHNEIVGLEEDLSAKSLFISQLTHDIDSVNNIHKDKQGKKNLKSKKTKTNQTKPKPKKKNKIQIQINNIPFAEHSDADTNYVADFKTEDEVENILSNPNNEEFVESTEKIYVKTGSNSAKPVSEKKKKQLKIQFGNFTKQVSFSKQRFAGIKTSM